MIERKKIDDNSQNEENLESEMEKAGWDKRFKDDYLWKKNNPDDYEDYSL